MGTLKMQLLGDPLILYDPLQLQTKKVFALLAYLAVRGEPIRREYITTLLWEDSDESHARSSLRRYLSVVHNDLNKERLIVTTDTIALKQDPDLWVDVRIFNTELEQVNRHHTDSETVCAECVQRLKTIVELYRGDFLRGFTLRDSVLFDDWQHFEADKFRQALNTSLKRLVKWYLDTGHYEEGIHFALRWSQLEALADEPIRHLMLLYIHSGQRTIALQCYKNFEGVLDRELGVVPMDETIQLYEEILEDKLRPRFASSEKNTIKPPHNLPGSTKIFVGREHELENLQKLLHEPNCHLITLVAPGGMGKTRLAIETAHRQLEDFPQGVFYVALYGQVLEQELLAQIAIALGHQFYPGVSFRQQIIDLLRHKSLLLLLDNFECYTDNLDFITELLREAPFVKIMVMSQRPLHLEEEWVCQIKGLGLPVAAEATQNSLEYDAVAMFVRCAKKLHWDYRVEDHLLDVVELCRYVEGMPLALELLATSEGVYACKSLLAELKTNLDSLQSPYANTVPRHSSLKNIFEYSWNHLSDDYQKLLLALLIFEGGFTYHQATTILNTSTDLLDELQRL
jgi:DNA-binding SARP family transcriptional activator